MILNKIWLFVFGAAMGSAGNALIDRLPKDESWIKGRSHCDRCHHLLEGKDLIPIFSYLFLFGKCRYCQSPIPLRNLIVELLTGTVSVMVISSFNLSNFLIFAIFWITLLISVMDWNTKLISEWLVLFWAVLAIVETFPALNWLPMLFGIGFVGVIWAYSRGKAMGFGDVEIAGVMGWSLGWPNIVVALWFAFVGGALLGLMMMILKKAKFNSTIAFGPLLIFGYWVAKIWGELIVKYYGIYV